MKIELIFEEIKLHVKRIELLLPDIESWFPLSYEDFDNIEKVKTIDSFIYRFIKVQDKIGEKLFPALLSSLQEYDRGMPFIDILNKLEKLRILPSADDWVGNYNFRIINISFITELELLGYRGFGKIEDTIVILYETNTL